MPGTNTSTGSRSYEKPSSFLQSNDPSRLLRTSQQAATSDSLSQSYLGNQNQDTAYIRRRNANIDEANLNEQAQQNDFGRRMQEKEWDAKQAGKTISITNTVDNSGQINFNRQKELMQMQSKQEMAKADQDRYNQQLVEQQRQNSDRTQQAAQLAAQERLARISQ